MTTAGANDQQRLDDAVVGLFDSNHTTSQTPLPNTRRHAQQTFQNQHVVQQPPKCHHQQAIVANNLPVNFHNQDKNFVNQQQLNIIPTDSSVSSSKTLSIKQRNPANNPIKPAAITMADTTCNRYSMQSFDDGHIHYAESKQSYAGEEDESSEEMTAVASAEEYAAKIIKLQQACLIPLKEDLADWLNKILKTSNITTDNFMNNLDNGVIICRLAKIISLWCEQQLDICSSTKTNSSSTSTTNINLLRSDKANLDELQPLRTQTRSNLFHVTNGPLRATTSQSINCLTTSASATSLNTSAFNLSRSNYQFLNNLVKMHQIKIWEDAKCRTFYARDNVCNFIKWSKDFGVNQSVLFESDDLVLHANPRQVVLCLLDVARIAYVKYGFTEAPGLVKFEQEIDKGLSTADNIHVLSKDKQFSSNLSDERARAFQSSCDAPQSTDSVSPKRLYVRTRNSIDVPIDATDELIMRYCRHKEAEAARKRNEELLATECIKSQTEGTCIDSNSQLTIAKHCDEPDSVNHEDKRLMIETSSTSSESCDDVGATDPRLKSINGQILDNEACDDQSVIVSSTTCDLSVLNSKNLADTGRIDSLDSGEGPTESASTGHSSSRLVADNISSVTRDLHSTSQTSIPIPKKRINFASSQTSNKTESSMTNSELSSSRSSLLSNQDGNNSTSNYECQATSDLDGKVMRIAKSYYGKKATKDVTRLSEGKYKIADRVVFVRLLKGHRVMVRIGGGWDTLENFLFRHKSDPSQIIDPENLLPLETKMPFDKTPQITPTKFTTKLPYYKRCNSASSTNLSLSNLSISNYSLVSNATPTTNHNRSGGFSYASNSVQSSPTINRSKQQIPCLVIQKNQMAMTNNQKECPSNHLSPFHGKQPKNQTPNTASDRGSSTIIQLKRPLYYQKTTSPYPPSKHSLQRPLASSTAPTASAINLNGK